MSKQNKSLSEMSLNKVEEVLSILHDDCSQVNIDLDLALKDNVSISLNRDEIVKMNLLPSDLYLGLNLMLFNSQIGKDDNSDIFCTVKEVETGRFGLEYFSDYELKMECVNSFTLKEEYSRDYINTRKLFNEETNDRIVTLLNEKKTIIDRYAKKRIRDIEKSCAYIHITDEEKMVIKEFKFIANEDDEACIDEIIDKLLDSYYEKIVETAFLKLSQDKISLMAEKYSIFVLFI